MILKVSIEKKSNYRIEQVWRIQKILFKSQNPAGTRLKHSHSKTQFVIFHLICICLNKIQMNR